MDRAEAIEILERNRMKAKQLADAFEANFPYHKSDYRKDEELYDMAIAALREQEQSKWISVKDEMPKRMKRYFIAYKFDGSDMRFYGEAMFHPEGGNGCVDRPHFSNEGVDGMYVTHWMEIPKLPLPEPPKEGAEG